MKTTDTNPEYWRDYHPFQHVKHDLIKRYLDGWFPKLGTWAGRVVYIDTHAGRGRHSSGQMGSPLVALNTLLGHSYRDRLLENSEVQFFLIEQDPENLKRLTDEFNQIEDLPSRIRVNTSAGDAYEVLSGLMDHLRQTRRDMAPAFIFIDPYGFKVPGKLLKALMAAGRVELFVNVIWRELDMAMRQHPPRGHGLAKVLDDLFTEDGWRSIDGETRDERIGQAMSLLASVIGAEWSTHFRMTTGGSATRYVLLHMTNHDAGRDLMKECMWQVAPGGDFEIWQCDDPRQPVLFTPEPDLTPLREWLMERLRQKPYANVELKEDLRATPWLVKHLNAVTRELIKGREIRPASGGILSLTDSPRLPGLG